MRAVDPNYESVYEKRNAAFAGCGMVLMKYTGARGKSESSDASAEFVYEIGKILDDNGVICQTSELGNCAVAVNLFNNFRKSHFKECTKHTRITC